MKNVGAPYNKSYIDFECVDYWLIVFFKILSLSAAALE